MGELAACPVCVELLVVELDVVVEEPWPTVVPEPPVEPVVEPPVEPLPVEPPPVEPPPVDRCRWPPPLDPLPLVGLVPGEVLGGSGRR